MIRSLHSPEAVTAFRALLANEPTETLRAALAELEPFQASYFETGDAGSFTRQEIGCFLEDRERELAGA